MELYLDTANIREIEQAVRWGVIQGVTTNPSLIAKEQRDFEQTVKQICKLVPGPVSAEVTAETIDGMLEQGRKLADLDSKVVIKVPVTLDGLEVVHQLNLEGIRTNATLVFSANQALLAARAGATFVSPFVGRLDDIGWDGIGLVDEIAGIFALHSIPTKIIAASIRHVLHVTQAAKAGAHIATIPFKVIQQMIKHPLTDTGIEKFMKDWEAVSQTKTGR